MTKHLGEVFGSSLVRVLKRVRRKSGDGGTKTVDQAFHVKKAAPGDRYAAHKRSGAVDSAKAEPSQEAAGAQEPAQPADQQGQDVVGAQDPSQDPAQSTDQGVAPQQEAPLARMTVRRHDIPWLKKNSKKEKPQDPIPAEVRKKFDKKINASPLQNSVSIGLPTITVVPTDRILWGADEPGLLVSLRSGTIKKMRLAGGSNGLMIAKIEAIGGGTFYGYMWMESLRCPLSKQLWGDIIDFSADDGPLSRRAVCSYEVAKACGLDDLTPPTVHRVDEEGDIRSLLPDSLIEQVNEWVSNATGKDPGLVREQISGHATIQLVRGEPWPIESEEWFRNLFGNNDPDALNSIWAVMPPERRVGFLRMAALDFVIGSLDRSFGDMAFSDDVRHPVMVFGGELSMPCPRTIGLAYASGGYGGYVDDNPNGLPLFWSEVSTMLAVRGGDAEIADYESIGISISSRMRGDRAIELAKSLMEHKLTALQISGVLSRIWMMETHSKDIAKDPYFAARYYASLVSGPSDPLMNEVGKFVNNIMHKVLIRKFDFHAEMKSGGKDEDNPR